MSENKWTKDEYGTLHEYNDLGQQIHTITKSNNSEFEDFETWTKYYPNGQEELYETSTGEKREFYEDGKMKYWKKSENEEHWYDYDKEGVETYSSKTSDYKIMINYYEYDEYTKKVGLAARKFEIEERDSITTFREYYPDGTKKIEANSFGEFKEFNHKGKLIKDEKNSKEYEKYLDRPEFEEFQKKFEPTEYGLEL